MNSPGYRHWLRFETAIAGRQFEGNPADGDPDRAWFRSAMCDSQYERLRIGDIRLDLTLDIWQVEHRLVVDTTKGKLQTLRHPGWRRYHCNDSTRDVRRSCCRHSSKSWNGSGVSPERSPASPAQHLRKERTERGREPFARYDLPKSHDALGTTRPSAPEAGPLTPSTT